LEKSHLTALGLRWSLQATTKKRELQTSNSYWCIQDTFTAPVLVPIRAAFLTPVIGWLPVLATAAFCRVGEALPELAASEGLKIRAHSTCRNPKRLSSAVCRKERGCELLGGGGDEGPPFPGFFTHAALFLSLKA